MKLKYSQLFAYAVFLTGCCMPLTFLRVGVNFQLVDALFLLIYLLFARKAINLFALVSLVTLGALSLFALAVNDRQFRDYFEAMGDLLQIGFLAIVVLPIFRSMDDELHRVFFRGFVVSTGLLAALLLTEVWGIADWKIFESMYLQMRWSIVLMEPNSTARIFFTAFAALFAIGNSWIFRSFHLKVLIGLLLIVAGMLTGSRTFYLAVAVLCLTLVLIWRRRWLSIAVMLLRRYWISLAIISLLALALLRLPSVSTFVDETMAKALGPGRTTLFTSRLDPSTGLTSDSDSQRIFLFKRSTEAFLNNFFLGTGLSMSVYEFNDFRGENIWTARSGVVPTIHNAFIGFVLEAGIVGLILMTALAMQLALLIHHCPRKELVLLLTVLTFDLTSTLQWTRMNWVPILAFMTWSWFLIRQARPSPRKMRTTTVVSSSPVSEGQL